MYVGLQVRCLLFLSDLSQKFNISTNFAKKKKPQSRISRKSMWLESTFMRTKRQLNRHDETKGLFSHLLSESVWKDRTKHGLGE